MSIEEYNERRAHEADRQRLRKRRQRPAPQIRRSVKGQPCIVCGAPAPTEIHHIVPRAKFSRDDKTCHAVQNLIPVCHQCHQDHHSTAKRIPRRCLSRRAVRFVLEHTSEAWLDLWYPA